MAPIDIVYNEARLQYLDYTHPTHYSEMAIFSKKLSFSFHSFLLKANLIFLRSSGQSGDLVTEVVSKKYHGKSFLSKTTSTIYHLTNLHNSGQNLDPF